MWWDTIKKKRRVATGPRCDQTEILRVIKNLLYKEQRGFSIPGWCRTSWRPWIDPFTANVIKNTHVHFGNGSSVVSDRNKVASNIKKKPKKLYRSTSTKMHIWLSESKFHWQTQALQHSNRITTVSELLTVSGCKRLKTCRLEGDTIKNIQITQWWTQRDLKACHFSLGSRLSFSAKKCIYIYIYLLNIWPSANVFDPLTNSTHFGKSVIICQRLTEVTLAIPGG